MFRRKFKVVAVVAQCPTVVAVTVALDDDGYGQNRRLRWCSTIVVDVAGTFEDDKRGDRRCLQG